MRLTASYPCPMRNSWALALRPPERSDWKAAGVLVYTFDPYGELMVLLGRTFMYSAEDGGGPPGHI